MSASSSPVSRLVAASACSSSMVSIGSSARDCTNALALAKACAGQSVSGPKRERAVDLQPARRRVLGHVHHLVGEARVLRHLDADPDEEVLSECLASIRR